MVGFDCFLNRGHSFLAGGFKHFLFSTLPGKWSNLTNTFQMGWFNHQPDLFSGDVVLYITRALNTLFVNRLMQDPHPSFLDFFLNHLHFPTICCSTHYLCCQNTSRTSPPKKVVVSYQGFPWKQSFHGEQSSHLLLLITNIDFSKKINWCCEKVNCYYIYNLYIYIYIQ